MPTQVPAYPIAKPSTGNDTRFRVGLAIDVDLVGLQDALFNLIYQETR